jgi:hypothetical protein
MLLGNSNLKPLGIPARIATGTLFIFIFSRQAIFAGGI